MLRAIFTIFTLTLVLAACGSGSSTNSSPPATATPTPQPPPNPPPVVIDTTPKPDSTADPSLPAPLDSDYASAAEASRFLSQATFGATAKDIIEMQGQTRADWLNEQFNYPQTFQLPRLDQRLTELGFEPAPVTEDDKEGWVRDIQRSDIWWESAIWGKDQLRQKVAYALSQILVISNISDVLYNDSRGIAHYHDQLAENAFGNYRDILEIVTLSPMMGEYLSMIRNEKADQQRNIRPDENYAREVMQLFSIGLVELNLDGSVKLDANSQPIPTYGQDDIKDLARVFTGWNHGTITHWWEWVNSGASETLPMQAFVNYHDSGAKMLFGDQVIAANLSPQADIDRALDILFAHSNLAPFISKQLIQRLVTSNPSPAYVARVASVFNNNGNGIKGDLRAVVSAILLDDEAINGHLNNPTQFGKLREPMLKLAAILRAFKAQGAPVENANGEIAGKRLRLRATDREMGQRPYGSFSVFNFYRPDYQQPGEIKDADLLSPEFQIMTESQLVSATGLLGFNIYWRDTQTDWALTERAGEAWDMYPTQLYLEDEKNLVTSQGNAALLDKVNLLLLAGQMSTEMYNTILTYLDSMQASSSPQMRVYDAIFLAAASPEFAVQR